MDMIFHKTLANKLRGFREILYFDNRLQLVFSNMPFVNQSLQIYRKGNLTMLSDKSRGDSNGLRSLFTSEMYRQFFAEMNLASTISLLDLGANIGGFPLMLKHFGYDPLRYVGVEMHPHTYMRLCINITTNLSCRTTLLNRAVSNTDGCIKVRFTRGGTGESLRNIVGGGEEEITTSTLNSLIQSSFENQRIDLCKMDVEGSEYDIFFGEHFQNISQARRLLIEIHSNTQHSKKSLVQLISNQGFRLLKQADDVYYFHNTKN